MARPRLLAICLLALGVSGRAAAADDAAQPVTPDAIAEGRALFAEGRALAASGDYQAACPKFEQSLEKNPGIGTRFNLADCWQHLGRAASAQRQFLLTASAAHAAGQLDRERVANERAAALEPELSRPVLAAEAGTPTVRVPELALVRVPAASKSTKATARPASQVRSERRDDRVALRSPSILTLTVAAIGVSGLVSGTVFGLQYQSDNERASAICSSGNACAPDQIVAHDALTADARQARNLSFVSFGVGLLSLCGATAMYMRDRSQPTARWALEPATAGDGFWGVRARGRF